MYPIDNESLECLDYDMGQEVLQFDNLNPTGQAAAHGTED